MWGIVRRFRIQTKKLWKATMMWGVNAHDCDRNPSSFIVTITSLFMLVFIILNGAYWEPALNKCEKPLSLTSIPPSGHTKPEEKKDFQEKKKKKNGLYISYDTLETYVALFVAVLYKLLCRDMICGHWVKDEDAHHKNNQEL